VRKERLDSITNFIRRFNEKHGRGMPVFTLRQAITRDICVTDATRDGYINTLTSGRRIEIRGDGWWATG
jgi:hypothetical protein